MNDECIVQCVRLCQVTLSSQCQVATVNPCHVGVIDDTAYSLYQTVCKQSRTTQQLTNHIRGVPAN